MRRLEHAKTEERRKKKRKMQFLVEKNNFKERFYSIIENGFSNDSIFYEKEDTSRLIFRKEHNFKDENIQILENFEDLEEKDDIDYLKLKSYSKRMINTNDYPIEQTKSGMNFRFSEDERKDEVINLTIYINNTRKAWRAILNQRIYLSIQEETCLKHFYLTQNGKVIKKNEIFNEQDRGINIVINAKGKGGSEKDQYMTKKKDIEKR
jgi:hypothetical protein